LVLNKIDLVPEQERAQLPRGERGLPAVPISAQDRSTVAPLLESMETALWREGRMARPDRGGGETEIESEIETGAHPS
jgi:50S ribosomal subunit-associated GTPase HflX